MQLCKSTRALHWSCDIVSSVHMVMGNMDLGLQSHRWCEWLIDALNTRVFYYIYDYNSNCANLRCGRLHLVNGSPTYPWWQEQIGLWFLTLHTELDPHTPGQGSEHFALIHALSSGHSELMVHSGLHPGGLPMYKAKHEQTACSLTTLHWLLGPHGDGWQGLLGSGGESK